MDLLWLYLSTLPIYCDNSLGLYFLCCVTTELNFLKSTKQAFLDPTCDMCTSYSRGPLNLIDPCLMYHDNKLVTTSNMLVAINFDNYTCRVWRPQNEQALVKPSVHTHSLLETSVRR